MKSSKERKMERKAKHKALAVAKTEKSRQRRLDNKAKRDAILAIDPDIKVKVIDQVTYNEYGIEIMVENGKVKCVPTVKPEIVEIFTVSEDFDQKLQDKIEEIETVEVFNAKIEEVEAVEVDDVGKFQKLVNKWRL